MLTALNLIGLGLVVVALFDRRAFPFLALIGAVWWLTSVFEVAPNRMLGLELRIPVDMVAGLIALALTGILGRGWTITALFGVMLLNHAAFWFGLYAAPSAGVALWWYYSHTLNGLWLAQLIVVAIPGGRELVGICSRAWARLTDGRRSAGVHARENSPCARSLADCVTLDPLGDRSADARPCAALHRTGDTNRGVGLVR